MNNIIKLSKTFIYAAILGLLIISTSNATTPHSILALEHAVAAGTHGQLDHSEAFTQHAGEALKHAKAANDAHADSHKHATEAITHLKATAKHGEMGHTQIAIHANEALKHAEASEKAHADAHNHMIEAVKHLDEAVKHEKLKHTDLVAEHMQKAVDHIKNAL